MKRNVLILLVFLVFSAFQGNGQTWYFFQDSPDPDYYEFSWLTVSSPSTLEMTGYDGHRFPVESSLTPPQGINALRLHWTSIAGGDWMAIAASLDWTARDIATADTLTFCFRSESYLAKENLPGVFFEDINNNKSAFFPIAGFTEDLQPGVWTRIKIPMTLFFQAGGVIDYSNIKSVGYTQAVSDGQTHTVYIDDVKAYKGSGASPPVSIPQGLTAKGYEKHVFLSWTPNPETNVNGYDIYRSINGGATFTRVGTASPDLCMFTDLTGTLGQNLTLSYTIDALNDAGQPSGFSDTVTTLTHPLTDTELVDMMQEATFRYFWDFAHPVSGMARESSTSGNTVTTGGSGFGLMAILVGVERGYITRDQATARMIKITNFLENADRFHGVWPHWMNGNTGTVIPFGTQDNGGDLVETAYMVQGLLAARQYFNRFTPEELQIRNTITRLWESVEWDWYRKNGSNVLYWHWSPDYGWAINMQIRGWNECMIVYLLAIASPTHGVPASLWSTGWAGMPYYTNGNIFYGIKLDVGWDYGGPLFFTHYSFLGFDPRNKKDQFTNYFVNNTRTVQIDYLYCLDNPKNYSGYGPGCWGLTASYDPDGYKVHEPWSNDNGTISPTAALSSFPYTPDYSMAALKHFYRDRSNRLWGNLGFYDAFNLSKNWYSDNYLAIDQGPIIGMTENYRTGLLWNLFMANPEIQPALDAIGFVPDSPGAVTDLLLTSGPLCHPNPVSDLLTIDSPLPIDKIKIIDRIGQTVYTASNPGQKQIHVNVSGFEQGLYIVQITMGRQLNFLKFIKF